MIVVYHKNNRISTVVSATNKTLSFNKKWTVANGMVQLATAFPQAKIVWCNTHCQENLNLKSIEVLFHHNKMMLSYCPDDNSYLGSKIGYVEESPFIKVNKKVSYPTWQMSSAVGVIHAAVLLEIKDKIKTDCDFDYYLNSVAKIGMPLGLLCYSEPKLLNHTAIFEGQKASVFTLFRFVKQHYKTRWILLLFLNLMIYERSFPFTAFLTSLFYKNRNKLSIYLESINVQSSRRVVDQTTIDVIIPTIGRKTYLNDVLKDFSMQSLLPKKIIVVEQNPVAGSSSELDYIQKEKWPFHIKHIFTHQAGACNARNLALNQVESEWVFLADDDIRFSADFNQKALNNITKLGAKAVSISCLRKEERQTFKIIFQWASFGSGCSIVHSESLKKCTFKSGYEFGYGEDADFGMQLRNHGNDIVYLPKPEIVHLKAPMGGFRTKPVLKWHDDKIQPKPSPTVMLYILIHNTKQQLLGYKTTLFFKYYKHQKIKNPYDYYKNFQKQWSTSIFWAEQLKKQNEV